MNENTNQGRQLTVKEALTLAKKMVKKRQNSGAIELFELILQQEPKNPVAKKGLRKLQEAAGSKNVAANAVTDPPAAAMDTIINLYQSGHMAEVERLCSTSLVNFPQSSILLNVLASAQVSLGRLQQAVISYKMAIQINPSFADAYCNCGVALKKLGQVDEALNSYSKAIHLNPGYASAYSNQGVLLQELGRLDEALLSHNKAVQLEPTSASVYYNLGIVWKEKGNLAVAALNFKKATELQPNFAQAHCNYALALQELRIMSEALECYLKAITMNPNLAEAHANIGTLFQELGRLDESLKSYRKAIQLQPDYLTAYSNLLMLSNYLPLSSTAANFEVTLEYGRVAKKKSTPIPTKLKDYQTPSKLRVGFVSGDLNNHPVGYFLENFLQSVDKTRLELYAYPTTSVFDSLSERIRPNFASWKSLQYKSDIQCAELIAGDAIHILVDLAGHTQNNRLPIFAYKPAPIQVTWLGYFATTGLDEIDYFLGDHYVTPVDGGEKFTETIWRLPETRWCYTPPALEIDVSNLPALTNGYITFGCFGNLSKINDRVFGLWSKILLSIPESRLVLKSYQYRDLSVRRNVINKFVSLGVSEERIDIEGPESRYNYFQAYNRIDITLDTFPFSGGTTSVDSLWMGVPLITLSGNTVASRQGHGILKNVGLHDWIAVDEQDYLTKAVSFALNKQYLTLLRARLRPKALSSPLFDATRFARDIENALSEMWSKHQTLKDSAFEPIDKSFQSKTSTVN